MLTLFEQIDKGNLWQSHGGVHPPELKQLSNTTPIQHLPLAKEYWLPVSGLNETCTLTMKPGERVLKGQALTSGLTNGYLPCHAPTSGTFSGIENRISNHASGLSEPHIIILADGQDESISSQVASLKDLEDKEILDRVRLSGVAGLGGAAFPSHIKLNPVSDIELVIINGVECEPYITSDDRLMREHSDGILAGIEVIHRLLSPKRIVIAIEDNKPEAIEAMGHAISRSHLPAHSTRVTKIPTKYPSGGEKQLIQIITGNEVPSGAIPAQLGILVHNVGTAFAIGQAVHQGLPLTQRVVTLTGKGIKNPGNFWVPIGTPVQHLLDHGLLEPEVNQVICGGPMMGHTLSTTQVPIGKGTNCILVPGENEIAPAQEEKACIRCGECAQVCPAQLLPQQLFWHSKAEEYDKAASFNLRDCIECGSCSYVCPSDIPLVEYYRIAKSALRQQAEEKAQAERAKIRFDARLARLEQEKQEREAKAKQAAERRQKSVSSADKDKIAEAMARIQAKKQASAGDNTETKTTKKPDVSAAIARAKAKKAAQQQSSETESNDSLTDKKAKIAEAVARAKAKKAAQAKSSANEIDTDTPETTTEATAADDKKAKIAAAVARAKAKKAAQANADVTEPTTVSDSAKTESSLETAPVDDKKAKIAAAVARAKAKKAAQANADALSNEPANQTVSGEVEAETVTETSPADAKKARIAAAVAKAKAKKAAQANVGTDSEALHTEAASLNEQASEVSSQAESTGTEPAVETATETSPVDAKKARIAAAVAKAKAKKAAQTAAERDVLVTEAENLDAEENLDADIAANKPAPVSAAEDKKARIAAAVAKAKAKKLSRGES